MADGYFAKSNRDYDKIQESLGNESLIDRQSLAPSILRFGSFFIIIAGEISSPFYLTSQYYVPKEIEKMVNDLTSLMMENGFYEFHYFAKTFEEQIYQAKHSSINQNEDVVLESISFGNMKRPMALICGLWMIATLIFLIQHLVSKWRARRISKKIKEVITNKTF